MLPELKIGNLPPNTPSSKAEWASASALILAGAVAKAGGIGVISAAQPGWRDPELARDPLSANLRAPRLPHPPRQRNFKRRHHRRQYHVRPDPLRGIRPLLHRKRSRSHHLRAGLPTDLPKYTKREAPSSSPLSFPSPDCQGSSEALGQSLSPRP